MAFLDLTCGRVCGRHGVRFMNMFLALIYLRIFLVCFDDHQFNQALNDLKMLVRRAKERRKTATCQETTCFIKQDAENVECPVK